MAARVSSEQREYARQIYHEVLDSAEAQDDESYLEEINASEMTVDVLKSVIVTEKEGKKEEG